jgi:hypothetical protein
MTTQNKGLYQPPYNQTSPTWDVPLNLNFGYLDACLGSGLPISLTSSDYTMSASDVQNARVDLSGTITTNLNVNIPNNTGGFWIFTNSTTDTGAGYTVTVKTVSGSGVLLTRGYATLVYSSGNVSNVGSIFYALSDRLSIAGGTMIGNLNLPSNGLNVGSGQLQVTGGNVTTSGSITATGNVTAYSDQRLKEDIRTISDALSIVKHMRGVSYINKATGEAGIGVVAQEVLDVLPSVVHHDDKGMMHIAYGNIVGLLINAIKELTDRVEILEGRK